MNVQPSKHLILINGHTHQGPWFEGNSQLSFADPFILIECWRNYFNNQIINVAQNLWKNYQFMGSTDRIYVFGPIPYSDAITHLRVADHCNPIRLLIPGKLQRSSQFYIVDSVIGMLFTMSMNVILHEALLMVIFLMPLPLIKEWFLLIKMIPLFDWLAPRPKCFKNHVTKNPKLFQDTPDLAEDFDSPICLACTMAKNFNDYY